MKSAKNQHLEKDKHKNNNKLIKVKKYEQQRI